MATQQPHEFPAFEYRILQYPKKIKKKGELKIFNLQKFEVQKSNYWVKEEKNVTKKNI